MAGVQRGTRRRRPLGDRLRLPLGRAAPGDARLRAGRGVTRHGRKLTEQIHASYEEALGAGSACAPALRSWSSTGTRWPAGSTPPRRSRRSRHSAPGARRGPGTSPVSRRWSSAAAFRTGSAEISRGRERGDTIVFVAQLGPRRADHRAARRLRRSSRCRSSAPRTRTAPSVLVGIGHLSRGFRLPDAALQLWAETDVFEEERQVHERRQSATAHVPLRLPRSQDRRSRRPRRPRHRRLRRPQADRGRRRAAGVHGAPLRRRGQAVRAGRAARPGPEVHRRGAARARPARRRRPGRRPRRASRRRCATWPRSCSSSTPRARRCRATPSAPTRTGSRSSRTPSSGT